MSAGKEIKMSIKLKRQAIKLWNNPLAPRAINEHNRRAWLRSVQLLGDKWLVAKSLTLNDLKKGT